MKARWFVWKLDRVLMNMVNRDEWGPADGSTHYIIVCGIVLFERVFQPTDKSDLGARDYFKIAGIRFELPF